MRRRDFISGIARLAAAWPVAARAQQPERVRRIGALMNLTANDPLLVRRLSVFMQTLRQLGWSADENVRIDTRWSGGDAQRMRRYAKELVALAPDVLITAGGSHVGALQEATRTVPIIFVQVTDPVGAGLVASMARPGGNTTGFTLFEYGMAAKWLELLKDIAPRVTRAAVIRNPAAAGGTGQWGAIQSVAPSFGVELSPVDVRDADEIKRAVATFGRVSNSGLIVTSNSLAGRHRDLIISLAAKHRLPAVYFQSHFVTSGGLASYGPDFIEEYRQAAGYVDRILKGEKPADLPVQSPTKYELAINLKTAKALGLEVPPSVLVRADEVIE